MRFTIPHDHPCLAGHFPGRPIVPGVVVLDQAIALILRACPTCELAGLDEVKLLAPVPPDAEVSVTCHEIATNFVAFACTVAGRSVLRGRARLRATG